MCPRIPIVLVGNKIDSKDRKVHSRNVVVQYQKNIPYHEISAKSNFNVEKPFLTLARRLFGNAQLVFTNTPALLPPSIPVDAAHLNMQQKELEDAIVTVKPSDFNEAF
eukprot:gnl/Chilomastix_caulleri/1688.p2 GENE.gnl/Chilomastix_caulleri/1688~~gnl/Chilomastix_caulleri/1688.p2  ORF type:complete len:108 (+),score=34.92 gnl/Chilomastix_caulleri/1688:351-674(+)